MRLALAKLRHLLHGVGELVVVPVGASDLVGGVEDERGNGELDECAHSSSEARKASAPAVGLSSAVHRI